MKRRILAMALVVALAVSVMPAALALPYGQEHQGYEETQQQLYSDVPTWHWAYEATKVCSQRNWFDGYPDGTFRPNQPIKRAEAAKVFAQALALETWWDTERGCYPYTDISSHWARNYISAAVGLFPNVQNLRGTASFRPEQTITREEVVYALVVAWRYASLTRNADLSVLNMFTDANSISESIKPYMAVAIQKGLVSGFEDSTVRAQDGLTRAQFAALLHRALTIGIGPDDTSDPQIILDYYDQMTTADKVEISGRVTPAIGTQMAYYNTAESTTYPIYPDKNGNFRLELPLTEGKNEFQVLAKGLYSSGAIGKTISITQGGKEIYIRILSTVPSETDQERITFSGVVENYTSECSLLVNDKLTPVKENEANSFEATVELEPGENHITLYVLRRGEKVAERNIDITRYDLEGEGEWLDGLPKGVTASRYNIETKTQYREKTRETVNDQASSLEGWTLVSKSGDYGAWSEWQREAVTDSDTRKVETRQVTTPAKTQYQYHRYADASGEEAVCAHWGNYTYHTVMSLQYTGWLDAPLPRTYSGTLYHPFYSGSCINAGCIERADTWTVSHRAANGGLWYYEETRQIPGETVTEYRYADFVPSNTFERWSDWSEWTDGTREVSEEVQVETRTLYRFTKK